MALTFPRAMPDGVATEYFEPERTDFASPRGDGRVSGVTAGFPLWRGRWTLGRAMTQRRSEEWRAFVATLRGRQRTFFAGDQGRPYPLASPNGFTGLVRAGGGTFDGSATSWSVNADRDVPTLTGLPANYPLQIGDYIMWRWLTAGEQRRALCRAVEDATASGSGVVSITVEPPLPNLVPAEAIADLARPVCIMRQDTEATKLGEKGRNLKVDGVIAGVQDLRA